MVNNLDENIILFHNLNITVVTNWSGAICTYRVTGLTRLQ